MSDQPLSMMRIKSRPFLRDGDSNDDLLTIRILETSEKKMQLIKNLLTESDTISQLKDQKYDTYLDRSKEEQDLRSARSAIVHDERARFGLKTLDKYMSRSASNIKLTNISLNEKLSRKREALEFFFTEPQKPSSQTDLAIELRSGRDFKSSEEFAQKQQQILRDGRLGLLHRFKGFFNMIGLTRLISNDFTDIDDSFVKKCSKLGSEPYNMLHNLYVMKDRLEHEGCLERISDTIDSELKEKERGSRKIKVRVINSMKLKHQIRTRNLYPDDVTRSTKPQSMIIVRNNQLLREFQLPLFISDTIDSRKMNILTSEPSEFELGRSSFLKVNIISLRIIKHPLFTDEDILILKLEDAFKEYREASDEYDKAGKELLASMEVPVGSRKVTSLSSETIQCSDRWLKSSARLRTSHDLVLSLFEEFKQLREHQGDRKTLIDIKIKKNQADRNRAIVRQKLLSTMDIIMANGKSKEDREVTLLDMILEEESKYMNVLKERLELREESVIEETLHNRLLSGNRFHKNDLDGWIDCVKLRFKLNGIIIHESDVIRTLERNIRELKLRLGTVWIPIMKHESIDIEFELASSGYLFKSYLAKLLASSKVKVESHSREESLKTFRLNNEDIELIVDFSYELRDSKDHVISNRFRDESDIDKIYMSIFNSNRNLESVERKISRVINSGFNTGNRTQQNRIRYRSYFGLDPFVDLLGRPKKCNIRHSLLIWRWLNDLNQSIYLDKAENIIKFSSRPRFESIPDRRSILDESGLGLPMMENLRDNAIYKIKQYEFHLREILDFNARKFERIPTKRHDILREPEIHVDFYNIVEIVRSLVPRHTARRPLMPNRKAHIKSTSMGQSHGSNVDVENLSDWHGLASRQVNNHLNLVVTIQQATNLPMRSLSSHQPPTRSSSPFFPNPIMTPSLLRSQEVISPASLRSNPIGSPPTAYVEVIFQRKQRATSLVHGRNPSWNETLFIPVEFQSVQNPLDDQGYQSKLIDEYLQLNLYDYYCYLEDETGEDLTFDYEPSTLNIISMESNRLSYQGMDTINRSQRLSTSCQKIERHLLGSLRIPLSTLVSNSKIEGSFLLSQPLFLDNYQYEPIRTSTPIGSFFQDNSKEGDQDHLKSSDIMLSLFITLDPPLAVPIYLHFPVDSLENEQVFEYCKLWEKVMKRHRSVSNGRSNIRTPSSNWRKVKKAVHMRPIRHIRALVLQRGCKYCLINRLLNPLAPPERLLRPDDIRASMRLVARFVSLLSPIKEGQFSLSHLDSCVWFDPLQLLKDNLGGAEERAVLLCCYFLHMGQCSAILLGDAIPEGSCVYVIVWNEQTSLVHGQLLLQVGTLLETTGQGSQVSGSIAALPIDNTNFLSRLPVLMSSKYIQLWDPKSGKSFSLSDKIPLISVGSIVTPENVYANIQINEAPSETNFDIKLWHLWFPLFESKPSAQGPITSIQRKLAESLKTKNNWQRQLANLEAMRRSIGRPTIEPIISSGININYKEESQERCNILKGEIEKSIKANLLKWRQDRPTYFNRTLSRRLGEKIASFEALVTSDSEGPHDWRSELASLIKTEVLVSHTSTSGVNTRQIVSWPANMQYTSIKAILDSLYASGVHTADLILDPRFSSSLNTEFIVACHVHPYPANVLSLWLYVAALIPSNKRGQKFLMP